MDRVAPEKQTILTCLPFVFMSGLPQEVIMSVGIYQIRNLVNGKVYIGQSVNLERRWKQHYKNLSENKHRNAHLQSAFLLYGENAFVFEILSECSKDEMDTLEQNFVDSAGEFCYNIRKECVTSSKGIRFTEDHKEKISEAHRGKKLSEDTKRRMSENGKGKGKGRKIPKEELEARSNRMKGHSVSDETKRKISESLKGKMSGSKNPFYGKKHSEETKMKISKAKRKEESKT